MLSQILSLLPTLCGVVQFLNRLADWFDAKKKDNHRDNEIEIEARRNARDTLNHLRDTLDEPIDLDGLPDELFTPPNISKRSTGASVRLSDRTQSKTNKTD